MDGVEIVHELNKAVHESLKKEVSIAFNNYAAALEVSTPEMHCIISETRGIYVGLKMALKLFEK